jgi:hypothetical protein
LEVVVPEALEHLVFLVQQEVIHHLIVLYQLVVEQQEEVVLVNPHQLLTEDLVEDLVVEAEFLEIQVELEIHLFKLLLKEIQAVQQHNQYLMVQLEVAVAHL